MPNKNVPTKAWQPPNWGDFTTGPLRPLAQTLRSLSEFLAHPTFQNGIGIGDGVPDDRDPDTGVVTPAPITTITATSVTTPSPEVLEALNELDLRATAIETNPIPFTRITNVSISTPMLEANSVVASKLASINVSVGKFIRSASYVQGSAGWALDGNGNFEANNATLRGSVTTGVGPDRVEINTTPGFRVAFARNNQIQGTIDGVVGGLSIFAGTVTLNGAFTSTGAITGQTGNFSGAVQVGGNNGGIVYLGNFARIMGENTTRVQTQANNGVLCNIRVASVEYTGGLVFISDRNMKREIAPSPGGALEEILQTPIYSWRYDPDKTPTLDQEKHYGPMLDEVPEDWKVENERIDLNTWVAKLHQAVQELGAR